jgi:hypothetical protein
VAQVAAAPELLLEFLGLGLVQAAQVASSSFPIFPSLAGSLDVRVKRALDVGIECPAFSARQDFQCRFEAGFDAQANGGAAGFTILVWSSA